MEFPASTRIKLIPLSHEEVHMYLACDFSFEKHFGLTLHPRTVPDNVQKALRERVLARIETDPKNHLFYTLWVTIDKTLNTLVAGIVFKGPPNENGETELGAGTLDGFMNRGYMTETTKLLCEYAMEKMQVKKIVANCSPENVASQRTLEKSGFTVVKKIAENWSWEFQPKKL